MLPAYQTDQPARSQIDSLPGDTVLEFGANGCAICRAATHDIAAAMAAAMSTRPSLRHLRVEDGPGRPLGRSFRVKLWPTLVVLRDGRELARVVRPATAIDVAALLRVLDAQPGMSGSTSAASWPSDSCQPR